MAYRSLQQCLTDLEKQKMLIRVKEEVDPHLQMAAIHLRVHEAGGPALLFEKVKGTKFTAASNIFGTMERSRYIFRDTLHTVQQLIELKNNPIKALKSPIKNFTAGLTSVYALPLKNPFCKPVFYQEISIADLPLIKHWPMDGGAFVTLPQVYTEDADQPGIAHSNLGMYRIQLNGNEYVLNEEVGLHYQIHRGIGVHQSKANNKGIPLKVSVFIGGPPAHSVAAVMPLPEGMSELMFAGVLGGRRFRYCYKNGYCISTDADFVITGEVLPGDNKPEGPFGDHLGYYSLKHPFPVMKVKKVYAKKNAIWPFTVVGRPPQEDTSFGSLIHHISNTELQKIIPGLKEINAVDAAGVHPLLLAIGSERYTPFMPVKCPAELLTIANRIIGTGQLSLAKFLWITADDSNKLSIKDIAMFFQYMLERIDFCRDVHFYSNTSIDTLDYSGSGLNSGSKVVFAAYGDKKRELAGILPGDFKNISFLQNVLMIMPGIAVLQINPFSTYEKVNTEMQELENQLAIQKEGLVNLPLIIVADDASFTAQTLNNFLWVTFTRCNPSHDIYGVDNFTINKHWGCNGPLIIDARIKPHHAPALIKDEATERSINPIFEKGGSLYGVI
ncbi:MAG: UbiD family decarboxylase [Chitinophagaceae bacterium]|jgi:4-hydroxy-3-polyprenylbenzoate decarboxylase|nr:UbiD family decarboxylase [Chitinophagaceae bacterium]MBP6047273.1 UbiD family decarboxylase [Ferruginibacter sp.]MBK7088210.1 UbiD family decarboxylase [Chitinophagaceae bacterium]MBK7346952.1 UbiD family decarboxylase [Chitinophagaceae bacterium]MBK7735135.1 UbiD family decarboxylase [Chitinophagaceae bacterium]